MPVPTIFLINGNGEIVELSDQPYDSERLLQELLAKYPNVLAGDQMGGDQSRKFDWLLCKWWPVSCFNGAATDQSRKSYSRAVSDD
jgi:hypothetical protein